MTRLLTISSTCWLLAVGRLLGADAEAPSIEEELKAMQGLWKVTSAEVGGQATEPQKLGMDSIRVAGTKLTLFGGDKIVMSVEVVLDPTKSPKEMDWVDPKRGKYPLIYTLDGDKLQLCFPLTKAKLDAPLERPKEFNNPRKPIALLKAERQEEKD